VADAPASETLEQRKARIAALRRINAVLPKELRHPIPPLYDNPPSTEPASHETGTDTVDALLAMSRTEYEQHVCDHLAARYDDRWALFLHPSLVQFTHSVLLRKHTMVARLKNDPATMIGRRRRNFLELLESRLQQVESVLPDMVLTSDRDTARHLFAAIQAHRRALTANRVQPEEWDLKLWQAVDDLTIEEGQHRGSRGTP
jgi:hypothetical protein